MHNIGTIPSPQPFECPACGHTRYFEGPSGGMSMNVMCANETCRTRWNWTPNMARYEKIGRGELDRFFHWDSQAIPLRRAKHRGGGHTTRRRSAGLINRILSALRRAFRIRRKRVRGELN